MDSPKPLRTHNCLLGDHIQSYIAFIVVFFKNCIIALMLGIASYNLKGFF
jgi:hypothetical protein